MTRLRYLGWLLACFAPVIADAQEVRTLDSVVVTASRRPEPLSQVASTMQIIDEETIRKSPAHSITDLLAEHAVGFFSQWTPGQTLLNMRGGITEGQGRDFKSEILVLINGRRAGTANLSKLSLNDVERIEIIRGPASVVYGSSAIGGVVNLITRNGRNTQGSMIRGQLGTDAFKQGAVSTSGDVGRFDYYVGGMAEQRDDYTIPGGAKEVNTKYRREGGLAALGADLTDEYRFDTTVRTDGIYDAGFRGSQWDTNNRESRFNQSLDATLSHAAPNNPISWDAHAYLFRDVDDLAWGSEVSTSGAAGFSLDHNVRENSAAGLLFNPQIRLGPSTDLLLGGEYERSQLRNSRFRIPVPGGSATQTAPMDNNERNDKFGAFAEGVQRVLDDKLTLRGGARYTFVDLNVLGTPFQPLLKQTNKSFDDTTYSLGAAYQAEPWLNVRTGVSTGFRAPTATELTASYTTVGGTQVLGNSALEPESSVQYEVGVTMTPANAFIDVALFQNTIEKRIKSLTLSSTQSMFINNTGDAKVQGVEVISEYDLGRRLDWGYDRLRLFGNGVWNFEMVDKGADATLSGPYRSRIQRMYEWQTSLGAVYGQSNVWDVRLTEVISGPMYYDTEEILLIPQGEPNSKFVDRKRPFAITNLYGNYYPTPGVRVFGAVNNLLDKNYHPQFIALDQTPYISNPIASNGARGNSMPGREFFVGVEVKF